jgi:hypothetical protein
MSQKLSCSQLPFYVSLRKLKFSIFTLIVVIGLLGSSHGAIASGSLNLENKPTVFSGGTWYAHQAGIYNSPINGIDSALGTLSLESATGVFGGGSGYANVSGSVASSVGVPSTMFTSLLSLGDLVSDNAYFSQINVYQSGEGQFSGYYGFKTSDINGDPFYGWLLFSSSLVRENQANSSLSWSIDTSGKPIIVGAVPEPSIYALFGLAALALIVGYRQKVSSI